MRKLFTFLIALLACIAVFAEQKTVTFDFTSAENITKWGYGLPSEGKYSEISLDKPMEMGDIVFTNTKHGSSSTRFHNNNGMYELRTSANAKFSVSSKSPYHIVSITFEGTEIGYTATNQCDRTGDKTYRIYTVKNATDHEIAFTQPSSASSTTKVNKMTVVYEAPEAATLEAPELKIGDKTYADRDEDTFDNAQTIELSCKTTDSEIYYSINDEAAVKYDKPFTIDGECIISTYSKLGVDTLSGGIYAFYFKAAKPSFSIPSGSYVNPVDVTISTATEGATLTYIIGDEPAENAQAPVTLTISENTSILVTANKNGYAESESADAEYKFIEPINATINFVNFDQFTIADNNNWTLTYAYHRAMNAIATAEFSSADKQSSGNTIDDRPVTKGSGIDAYFNDKSQIVTASISLKQWGTNAQIVSCLYSTDGTSFKELSDKYDFSDAKEISPSWIIPAGTIKVKFQFSNSNNQVGITSITLGGVWDKVENLGELATKGMGATYVIGNPLHVVSVDTSNNSYANMVAVDGINSYNINMMIPKTAFSTFDVIENVVVRTDYEGIASFRWANKKEGKYAAEYPAETTGCYEYVYIKGVTINTDGTFKTPNGEVFKYNVGNTCYDKSAALTDRVVLGFFANPTTGSSARKKAAATTDTSVFQMYSQFETRLLGVEGISVDAAAAPTRIFNLQGSELKCNISELAPGLYIVNGKKMLVK